MASIRSFWLYGLDGIPATVTVEDGRHNVEPRIRAILDACGFTCPSGRVSVDTSPELLPLLSSLIPASPATKTAAIRQGQTSPRVLQRRSQAPADLPKQAASFDLPITLVSLGGVVRVEYWQPCAASVFHNIRQGGPISLHFDPVNDNGSYLTMQRSVTEPQ